MTDPNQTLSPYLLLDFLRSPNYVAGSVGWTINADGSAEFNNVTIRGGLVEDGLALYYNGAPALGNLIASIADVAGTDRFGNAYLAGVTVYVGSGAATEVVQINAASLGIGKANSLNLGGLSVVDTYGTQLSSPVKDVSDVGAIINLLSEVASGGNGPVVDIVQGALQSVAGTQANPTIISTDGTHALGSLGVTHLSISTGNYMLLPDGGVWVSIKGAATGAVAAGSAAFPNAITAALRPGTETVLAGGYPAGPSLALAAIGTGGAVTLFYPAMTTGNAISVCGRYDLQ